MLKEPRHPLAEVFGHLTTDQTSNADRYRTRRLCPFNNKVPNCTKDKANAPLGVCSIFHEDNVAITCPIRFREDWIIADDAASFFFGEGASWSSLIEVRLNDAMGKSAGNIDVVLAEYNDDGKIVDFGALEVQAVYISGNVREPFEFYMQNPVAHGGMDWRTKPNYPRPDYLSSSRKRLVPQLLYKGGIFHSWQKKMAVALTKNFFDTLPPLASVTKSSADIAWLLYELQLVNDDGQERFKLVKVDEVFTEFEPALLSITTPTPGSIDSFLMHLQEKFDDQIEHAPINRTIERPF